MQVQGQETKLKHKEKTEINVCVGAMGETLSSCSHKHLFVLELVFNSTTLLLSP